VRLAIAGFSLESVTFLPDTTGVDEFDRIAIRGDAMIDALRGTNTAGGGFVKVCEREGVEMVGLVYADVGAAAAASDAAFDKYAAEVSDGLRALGDSIDGLLIHLHGALATPSRQDADADFLEVIRETVGPATPVMVAMDLHGNLGPAVIEHATAVCGYHHSPHTDMAKTGERAANMMVRTLRGEIRPICAIARPGVVLPSIFSYTGLQPLADIMAEARALEAREDGLLDVTIFCGFAYADVRHCGMSVVAVADGDPALAARVAEDLSNRGYRLRRELFKRELIHGVEDGVQHALEVAETADRPVVLLEHADRLNDSTYVLRELMRRGTRKVMVPYMFDPEVARKALAAEAGATITVALGGKSSPQAGGPMTVTGELLYAGEKQYKCTGPLKTGRLIDLGPTAVIDADGIIISVISLQYSAIDRDCFDRFGFDPTDFDLILLRSKTHFRHVYEPLAAEIVIIDTPDWGPAELTALPYKNLPEGSFPVNAA
jgi:microcystin degradation protein MlrC